MLGQQGVDGREASPVELFEAVGVPESSVAAGDEVSAVVGEVSAVAAVPLSDSGAPSSATEQPVSSASARTPVPDSARVLVYLLGIPVFCVMDPVSQTRMSRA